MTKARALCYITVLFSFAFIICFLGVNWFCPVDVGGNANPFAHPVDAVYVITTHVNTTTSWTVTIVMMNVTTHILVPTAIVSQQTLSPPHYYTWVWAPLAVLLWPTGFILLIFLLYLLFKLDSGEHRSIRR